MSTGNGGLCGCEGSSFDKIHATYIIIQCGDAMPSEYYKDILELAVLEACEDELGVIVYDEYTRILNHAPERLSKSDQERLVPKANIEIGQSISKALSMFRNFKSGAKPIYDHPWVPLLHASWYHLGHVNFLQTELARRLKRHAKSNEVIRVVDFGCGTMPVMWAIALVLADPDNGMTQQKVHIYNHDTSQAMWALGDMMWKKLEEIIPVQVDEGRILYDAIGRITESKENLDSNAHLLTAIHCLYDKEGCTEIKNIPIVDKCVMLHQTKYKKLGLKFQESINGPWSGELEKLTNSRKEKLGCYCSDEYLRKSVNWDSSGVVLVDL